MANYWLTGHIWSRRITLVKKNLVNETYTNVDAGHHTICLTDGPEDQQEDEEGEEVGYACRDMLHILKLSTNWIKTGCCTYAADNWGDERAKKWCHSALYIHPHTLKTYIGRYMLLQFPFSRYSKIGGGIINSSVSIWNCFKKKKYQYKKIKFLVPYVWGGREPCPFMIVVCKHNMYKHR